MDPLFWILLGLGCALAAASAVISAGETAVFAMSPQELDELITRSGENGRLATYLQNPRRLLATLFVADALVNAPLIVLCFELLSFVPGHVPFWLSSLTVFGVIVGLCDLGPKLWAFLVPRSTAFAACAALGPFLPALDPLARVLTRVADTIADWVTPKHLHVQRVLSEDELETLVDMSTQQGALMVAESEMIQEIIKLGDKSARDCMTPRVDLFALPDDLENDEAHRRLRACRHHCVPVFGETPDDIIGTLDSATALMNSGTPYVELLEPPSFVPETMPAIQLLHAFLKKPQGMAYVVDEHGGLEGVITLTDLVEEIVGDALPIHDRRLYIEGIGTGRWVSSGVARLEDIGEELDIRIPSSEGIDTIGGLLFHHFGQLPLVGSVAEFEGFRATVRRVAKRRVEEVLIEKTDSYLPLGGIAEPNQQPEPNLR
jgi:CBS domain containing-hemolysin-like protein